MGAHSGTEFEKIQADPCAEGFMKRAKRRIKAMLNAMGFPSNPDFGSDKAETREALLEKPCADARPSDSRTSDASKKESFSEKLKADFAAIAFAEAGEFDTARDMAARNGKPRTVLLAIEGERPSKMALDHALGLCKRMSAELDVLQLVENPQDLSDPNELGRRMSEASSNVVTPLKDVQKQGIPFKITLRLGDVNDKLINYVKRHKDVAIVVFDSPCAGSSDGRSRHWRKLVERFSQKLAVPLVTIAERNPLSVPS
jgi:nucleotide-binding universal stress UspA family protein